MSVREAGAMVRVGVFNTVSCVEGMKTPEGEAAPK